MANGRFSAAETFSLRVGLIRFQSKVAMNTTNAASSRTRLARLQVRIFRPRVMHNSFRRVGCRAGAAARLAQPVSVQAGPWTRQRKYAGPFR